MSGFDLLQFYKELYNTEIERSDRLRNALTIPIGITSILVGVLGFYLQSFRPNKFDLVSIIFTVLLLLSLSSLLRAIYFIIKSHFGFEYMYLPSAAKLDDYYKGLIQYHKDEKDGAIMVETGFKEFLVDTYIDTTNENTWVNDSKSQYLYKANKSVIIAIAFVLICAIPYYIRYHTTPERVQKVQILNKLN